LKPTNSITSSNENKTWVRKTLIDGGRRFSLVFLADGHTNSLVKNSGIQFSKPN